jgi:hypothetical protein
MRATRTAPQRKHCAAADGGCVVGGDDGGCVVGAADGGCVVGATGRRRATLQMRRLAC